MSELSDLFKVIAEGKKHYEDTDPKGKLKKQIREEIKTETKVGLAELMKELSQLKEQTEKMEEEQDETQEFFDRGKEIAKKLDKINNQITDAVTSVPPQIQEDMGWGQNDIQQYVKSDAFKNHKSVLEPPNKEAPDIKSLKDKIKFLEQWVSRIASTGPGSGEVNFRYLDDVNRFTMEEGNDNWVLEYDTETKKVQFTENIGPIQTVKFNTSHVHDEVRVPGTLCWSSDDRTLNLTHPNDVVQQVGQETFFLVKNETGSTILNGTSVRFSGATNGGGQARLLVAPWLADGTYPSLYVVGIATEDIEDGAEGHITNFGKLRELNTTGSSVNETWQLGDILYAHPTIAGGLTRVKPTAPQNVTPMAAVIKVSSTTGELFVRPTIYPPFRYATFIDKTTQTQTVINTPKAISYNTTEVSSGHRLDPDPTDSNRVTRVTALVSGRYNYKFSIQLVSTNSSAKDVWIWFRKNGVDIPDSATRKTIVGNSVYDVASWDITVSMNVNDYFQIMWAVSDTAVSIPAPVATAFAPAIPSVILNVTEAAL